MHKNTFLSLLIAIIFSGTAFSQSSIATYSVTFDSNWTQAAHPHSSGNLPATAHWSKLVGATHNSSITFFEMGGIATQGVENIAETGSNTVFFSEVNNAITAETAYELIDGPGLSTAAGQITINNIMATDEYPLMSLLSMIAPSPDWMIALNSIPLRDGSNEWITEIVIDVYPYDAGTDSGVDYSSPDSDVTPHDPISSLQSITPFSSEIIGTVTISLDDVVLGVNDFDTANTISLYPNPASNNVTVSTANRSLNAVEIYNTLGEKIMDYNTINNNELVINIDGLSSGIYLMRVLDASNRETVKKLVKM